METEKNETEVKERIESLMREYLGKDAGFDFDAYLKIRNIRDINSLNLVQKKQFADELAEKIIRPATSIGKTTMARLELMSILGIGVEPWRITPNYVPSPREYLLGEESKTELRKLINYAISKEALKHNLKDLREITPPMKQEIVGGVVLDVFGSLPHATLSYSKSLFDQYPTQWVVDRSLATYMAPEKAKETGKRLTQLLDTLLKTTESPKTDTTQIQEELLSKKIADYFDDTNQLLIRRLKTENDIDNRLPVPDDKKHRILHGIMTHHFGFLSSRFLDMEYGKLGIRDADDSGADRIRLINAIIHDCLHTSMTKEDAKHAHEELNKLLT